MSPIIFRCSSLGKIMTNARSGSGLSETTKSYLLDKFIEIQYGRKRDIDNKYIDKGKKVEESSFDLYSLVRRNYFKKNKERLTNPWITGEPDLFIGKDIVGADSIIDIKSSWNLHTFMEAKYEGKINKDYYWQGIGYLALSGAKSFTLAYCLVNTPFELIADEKRRLAYRMGIIDDYDNPDYVAACNEIDKNSIFDDIPLSERVFEVRIERDNTAIKAIQDRVLACREYMEATFWPENKYIIGLKT